MPTSPRVSKVARSHRAGIRLVIALVLAQLAGVSSTQAETAVSNLGNFHNGNFGILQEDLIARGRAQSFTTGSDFVFLDSATLAMSSIGVSGSGGFQVSLYGDDGSNLPGSKLLQLTGSDAPTDSAGYTFTAPVQFTLAPSTTYWIVAELQLNTAPNTSFFWTFTVDQTENALPGWSMGNSANSSSFMGSTPSWGPQSVPLRMSVGVQPVPEPATASIIGIALVAMFGRPRRGSTRNQLTNLS